MRKFSLSFVLSVMLSFTNSAISQQLLTSIAGKAGFYTLEYQQLFLKDKKLQVYAGIGVSGFAVDQRATIVLPFTVGCQQRWNTWEAFAGLGFSPNFSYYYQAFSVGTSPSRMRFYSRSFVELGVRRYFSNECFSLGLSYTPLISFIENFQWEHWGAITLGYHFKNARK